MDRPPVAQPHFLEEGGGASTCAQRRASANQRPGMPDNASPSPAPLSVPQNDEASTSPTPYSQRLVIACSLKSDRPDIGPLPFKMNGSGTRVRKG